MNHNKKVVVFVVTSTLLFILFSLVITYSQTNILSLNKISVVSDMFPNTGDSISDSEFIANTDTIIKQDTLINATSIRERTDSVHIIAKLQLEPDTLHHKKANKSFVNYMVSKVIINFNKDTSKPALPAFMKKLVAIKNGKKDKVRIAWFGDSIIEGDLITKTFRKRMQQFFGGGGVGFVPATSVTSAFRNTIVHKWKGDWKEESFKTSNLKYPLYISGHTFFSDNGEITLTDKTVLDANQFLEKSLICGASSTPLNLIVNGQNMQFSATKNINRLLLDSTNSKTIDVIVQTNNLPVYGLSVEPKSGVVVDNFSFRGISGLELGKLDTTLLSALESENFYDLVILEYGANLMYRPNDIDYSWYRRHIINVVSKLQKAMPNTEFLIVSTTDRAFMYDGKWKTALGIKSLIKTQAETAYFNDAAFFNLYTTMGGDGTIVRWADSSNALANKDYVHPNFSGADILGNMLYDAFMKDFRKAVRL